ncbi:MAG: hypothetical protein K2Z81_23415 [Cyanobacteria bacterium]|nr:hypothetical protein [Cyanobacteriota bacterium]
MGSIEITKKSNRKLTSFLAASILIQQLFAPAIASGSTADSAPLVVSHSAAANKERQESSTSPGTQPQSQSKNIYYQKDASYTTQNLIQSNGLSTDDEDEDKPAERPTKIAQSAGMEARDLKDRTGIDELTRKILLKQIEMERFNLHYTQEVAKQGRWKGWRYAAFNEANSGLGVAGGCITAYERGRNLHHPQGVVRRVQEQANLLPMYGSIISATGAGLEMSINQWHDFEARRKGYAPKAAHERIKGFKADIDIMMAQREALIKDEENDPALACRVKIDRAEGKVINDLVNQSILEFARFQIRARRLLAFQQSQYLFDICKNVFNAIGCEEGYLALHKRDRRYNFKAGIMFLVSGGFFTFGPIASRTISAGVARYHRYALHSTIEQAEAQEVALLEHDMEDLDVACKTSTSPRDVVELAVVRGEIYGKSSKSFQDEINRSQKANDAAKLVATQNIASGVYVGGSKIASGVMFTVVGGRSAYNNGKTLRSSRVTNDLLFTSGIIGLPASAYTMVDTLRIQVKGEINRHKQKKENRTPAQLTAARLKQLDELENRLKSL